MSLATRCTACGTVFRVVQDQLKVSEGWVRCGRCQEVFNALETLFDLDREPHAAAPAATALPADEPAPDVEAGFVANAAIESRMSTQFDTGTDDSATSSGGTENNPSDGAETDDSGDFADARFNVELIDADEAEQAAADAAAEAEEAMARAQAEAPEPRVDDAEPAPEDEPVAVAVGPPEPPPLDDPVSELPTFVQSAERAARWRSPRRRLAVGGAAVALLAALALQVALQFHDALAARWPPLRAPLAALCEAADCRLAPPLTLQAVSVDGSGLARLPERVDVYRFSLVLRNHADHAVATPAVELSLTDASGRLLSRRVLWPADFDGGAGSADGALPAAAEAPLQLLLASDARIAGYTIELFYP
jgi:predicted Zn finger-like uncharacterized protein